MPVSTEELIAINSLLIEREAAFARVHELEATINQRLGVKYPFPAPTVALPALVKKKPFKTKKQQNKTTVFKARRLLANEVGYRISSLERGQISQQELTDLRLINPLLQENLPDCKLITIETINLTGQVIDTLFPQ